VIGGFARFLDKKPLAYKEIDPERIRRAYAKIRDRIAHPPCIHIVGTNGKGSTGRMIAHLARSYGMEDEGVSQETPTETIHHSSSTIHHRLKVGHYTSPHILRFNERIWIDGEEAGDEALEAGHRRLYGMLGKQMSEALSYFEYTTLLALLLFEKCDLIVLEAGLGGEYDATNVAENKILTVVTPIGLDHQSFLGESIREIAATKLRSVAPGGRVLLAKQPYDEVYEAAERIAIEKEATLFRMEDGRCRMEDESVSEETLSKIIHHSPFTIHQLRPIAEAKGWPPFLLENAQTALKALEIVGIDADPQALEDLELFGRYYPLCENVRIDVGHNPLAARAIAEAMEPGTVEEIQRVLEELEIPWRVFDGRILGDENYLVFGSFHTVEAFLENFSGCGNGV